MRFKLFNSFSFVVIFVFIQITSCNRDDLRYHLKSHFPTTESDYYQADSLAGHFHNPNAIRDFKWDEHPLGKIVMKTNNIGLRNDGDTKIKKEKNQYRVIITGDSHIDGVLSNNESVAHFLEEGLNENYPSRINEVLNAGNGYYGPQNYLGVYYKFQEYNPDIFIVTIYTGNDFIDVIRIETENGRMNVPNRPNGYYDNLWKIDNLYSGFTGQYLNQLQFFETFPAYRDTALLITQQSLLKIKNLCNQNSSSLLVVLLPTKLDTEPQTDQSRINEVFAMMDFDESQQRRNREMVLSLSQWLDRKDIFYIDLQESYSNSRELLFWQTDYHVNIAGHKVMANEILNSTTINKD